MFHFHKVVLVHYLGEVNMFFMSMEKMFFLLTAVQNYKKKIKRVFPEL